VPNHYLQKIIFKFGKSFLFSNFWIILKLFILLVLLFKGKMLLKKQKSPRKSERWR